MIQIDLMNYIGSQGKLNTRIRMNKVKEAILTTDIQSKLYRKRQECKTTIVK